MKMTTLKSVAIAVGLASSAFGQATSPVVGYETQVMRPNEFNLLGIRFFNKVVASGTIDATTSSTLVDNEASFSLAGGTRYEIEFSSGATVNDVDGANFSGTTISGLSGIDATFEVGYEIRESSTVSSAFGEANSAGFLASPNADPTEADLLFIPVGAGFKQVFFSTFAEDPDFAGWLDAQDFSPAGDFVLDTTSGIFVQSRSTTPVNVVISGDIKTSPTAFSATNAFSLVGTVYPAGATLTTSGFSNFVLPSPNADPTEADLVFIPNGAGGFTQAFFSTFATDPDFAGWLDAQDFSQVPGRDLTAAILIQKRGPDINGVNSAPSFYNGL